MNRNNAISNQSISNMVLTKNAIKDLFNIDAADKKPVNIDIKLQVITIRKNDQAKSPGPNTSIYTASLSDGDFKYTGFIIFKEISLPQIEEGDVLRITSISPAMLNNQKSRVFIVKKYDVIEKAAQFIGNPELIKEDSGSKEKFPVQNNIANNTRTIPTGNMAGGNNSSHISHISTSSHQMNNTNNTYSNNNASTTSNNYNRQNVKNNHEQTGDYDRHKKSYYQPLTSLTTFSKDIQLFVRVVKKGELKTFNSKGGGNLFTFTIMDSDGTEMQATCFNRACEKFFNLIRENSVYEIIGGYVKINDKKYSSLKSDYKLIFDENTRIEEKEDDGTIKENSFSFVKISEIGSYQTHSIVDVFAYVLEAHEKFLKNTKIGEQMIRKLVIADDSEFKIELTLWKQFTELDIKQGQVISIKSAKVGDFNGRNLSSVDDTMILIDPMIREATELKLFCENFKDWKTHSGMGGTGATGDNTANTTICYIKDVLNALETEPDDRIPFSKIKATICTINHSEKNFYPGCPEKTCRKKLQQDTYMWTCNACGKQAQKPTYYYTLSLRIKDVSAEHWIDIFGDLGAKLFKITCEEYKDLIVNRDELKLKEISNGLEFRTFYFVVKPKMQVYNNIPKKKLNVYKIDNFEVVADSRRILKNLSGILTIKNR
jgi:replication factor A1